jgi:hypothetical protein
VENSRDALYFERVHAVIPILHKQSCVAWADDERLSPRACLRSAMRTIAASTSPGFRALGDDLYDKTRRMLESRDVHDDNHLPWMRRPSLSPVGYKRSTPEIELECIQAWLLLAYYDFKRKSEQHALLTAGRVFRLLQLSGFLDIDLVAHNATAGGRAAAAIAHQLDGSWRETEGKRRTLWAAFLLDRLSSMLNDRPWALHEELVSSLTLSRPASALGLLSCAYVGR